MLRRSDSAVTHHTPHTPPQVCRPQRSRELVLLQAEHHVHRHHHPQRHLQGASLFMTHCIDDMHVCMSGRGAHSLLNCDSTHMPQRVHNTYTCLQTHKTSIQASHGDGKVRLYLFQGRRFVLKEEAGGGGVRSCLIYQLEPCPSSRFVCVQVVMGGWRSIKHQNSTTNHPPPNTSQQS